MKRIHEIRNRKLNIIEQLIILNDDAVFQQVEDIINNSLNRPTISMLSMTELKNRAKKSNMDIKNGNLISQDDVEKQSQSW